LQVARLTANLSASNIQQVVGIYVAPSTFLCVFRAHGVSIGSSFGVTIRPSFVRAVSYRTKNEVPMPAHSQTSSLTCVLVPKKMCAEALRIVLNFVLIIKGNCSLVIRCMLFSLCPLPPKTLNSIHRLAVGQLVPWLASKTALLDRIERSINTQLYAGANLRRQPTDSACPQCSQTAGYN
jgi:hypothetical protein